MRGLKTVVIVALVAVLAVALVPSEGSEGSATVEDGSTWYCYGDHPTFIFPSYSEGITVDWLVTEDSTGASITPESKTESTITVNLSGHDRITVTQNVSLNGDHRDSMTIHVIPLHLSAGESFTVTFHDAGNVVSKQTIDNETVVEAESPHVIVPDIVRDGYEFKGWFEEGADEEFDPTQPILEDTDIYAQWEYAGVSGDTVTTVIVNNIYTVTFFTDAGLYCEPDEPGASSVSFRVGVLGGFDLVGSVTVTSTGGNIVQLSDGVYILTGVDRDITVNITGETVPTPDNDHTDDNPGDVPVPTGNDYTMFAIILIVLAVICIVLALYILRTRGSRV